MIMRAIRWPLGRLILLLDALTAPRPPRRDPAAQAALDEQTRALALYQFHACPFCVKTRRAIRRLGLTIELRDAQHDPDHRRELLEQGGRLQVPCLRIADGGDTRWLYESRDIIDYLQQRFGEQRQATA